MKYVLPWFIILYFVGGVADINGAITREFRGSNYYYPQDRYGSPYQQRDNRPYTTTLPPIMQPRQ